MGQFYAHCFETQADAAQAWCNAQAGVLSCAVAADGTATLVSSSGTTTRTGVVFPECDYLDVAGEFTPAQVLYVCSWGLGFVLLMWSFGFAIGAAKTAIRKL